MSGFRLDGGINGASKQLTDSMVPNLTQGS